MAAGLTRQVRSWWQRPLFQDWSLPVALVGLSQAEVWTGAPSHELLFAVLAIPMCGALAWRRRAPLAVVLVVLAAQLPGGLIDPSYAPAYQTFSMLYALFCVAARSSMAKAVLAWVGAEAMFIGGGELDEAPHAVGEYLVVSALVSGAWLLGRALYSREQQTVELGGQVAELERDREAYAQRAVSEERGRIARELHDVIAHSVSLMVVQAGAAEQLLDVDPQRVRGPIDAIQGAGRQAVVELRRLLGMLRVEGQSAELAPQPGMTDIPGLLAGIRDAGLSVQSDIDSGVVSLSPGVDLVVYRIVQEALTNVTKHAGPEVCVSVTISVKDGWVDVRVADNGRAKPGDRPGMGHGLIGMHERVDLYDGVLEAGPVPKGGYVVHVRLPLPEGTA